MIFLGKVLKKQFSALRIKPPLWNPEPRPNNLLPQLWARYRHSGENSPVGFSRPHCLKIFFAIKLGATAKLLPMQWHLWLRHFFYGLNFLRQRNIENYIILE